MAPANLNGSEIAEQRFDCQANDIFVVPDFAWRRHINSADRDAVLYTVSDAPFGREDRPIQGGGPTA